MNTRNYKFLILFLLTLATAANAQQTIFSVPTTDVLEKGKVYVETYANFKLNDQDAARRSSSFVPRVVVGAGGNAEVGLNLLGNVQPGADATILSPSVKWRPFCSEKRGVAVAIGSNLFVPVRNRSYKIGNYAYAQISKRFKSGTRLTAGGYHFTKSVVAPNAQRAGGQFGFEQTINKYLNVNADWITGKHAAGYFTPGIAFKPHPKATGYIGYSIGNANARQGNHFFYAAIAVNLN
jgi:hypothetical protein